MLEKVIYRPKLFGNMLEALNWEGVPHEALPDLAPFNYHLEQWLIEWLKEETRLLLEDVKHV